MTFLETPEKLTVIGGAVAILYLSIGGFFWALFKANQEVYEHLERDRKRFNQRFERSKKMSQMARIQALKYE